MSEEFPPDPDLDELPPEGASAPGPLRIRGTDPETGEVHEARISHEEVAAAFAEKRRLDEQA